MTKGILYDKSKDTEDFRRKLNDLQRHKMLKKLLKDILTDMAVCKMENWDIYEYPRIIKQEMERILENDKRKTT